MGGSYAAAMTLRGWTLGGRAGYDAVLSKALPGGWALELAFVVSAKNRSIISNRYALVHEARCLRLDQPDWEWAEPFGSALQIAEKGCLRQVGLDGDGPATDSQTIRDFTQMSFAARQAPYAGVSQKDNGS